VFTATSGAWMSHSEKPTARVAAQREGEHEHALVLDRLAPRRECGAGRGPPLLLFQRHPELGSHARRAASGSASIVSGGRTTGRSPTSFATHERNRCRRVAMRRNRRSTGLSSRRSASCGLRKATAGCGWLAVPGGGTPQAAA